MPPLATKPRPQPDARFVFGPEQDATYAHFSGGAEPFDADARAVGRLNAWWLAEAALLSYWDAPAAVPIFAAAGFDARLVEAGALQCYVAHSDRVVLVAFRGTEPDQWGDVLDDALFATTPWDRPGAFVHFGFKAALERVWPALRPALDALSRTRTIWFTGHSLGAALATLAADRYPATAGVCTFGSPRVGDGVFAAGFNARFGARSRRYVNDADVVTHVPPRVPFHYEHVGEARYVDPRGAVSPSGPRLGHYLRELFGRTRPLLEMTDALSRGVLHAAPDFLLDHMPRAYAVDLFNDYALHGD